LESSNVVNSTRIRNESLKHRPVYRAGRTLKSEFKKMSVLRSVDLPFIHVEHDISPPALEGTAVTRAGAIGVTFTSQSIAVWEIAGRTVEGFHPMGVSLAGGADLLWRRWSDVSEAVEFWLDETWLQRISGIPAALTKLEPRASLRDPVLVVIAERLCRAMSSGYVSPLKFEQLAIAAARRLLPTETLGYSSVAPLDDRRMRILVDFVEANLHRQITIDDMAREVGLSIFHFAKRFHAATGCAPYAFVIARRMTHAMHLLRQGLSVTRVAHLVSYRQCGHFRRQFVAHWGRLPGDR
jgi:AraC-like DNA-binding protein